MGLYRERILPPFLHLSMKTKEATRQRRQVVPVARGRVLEVGMGSGLNLPYYGPEVTAVFGLDPSAALLAMARKAGRRLPFEVEFVNRSAEDIPFDSESFDSVVTTWTLCSIPDPRAALGEMRRVLKPSGALIFIEHGLAPESEVAAWQRRLDPFWSRFAGGCHLDRPIDALIRAAGFALLDLETGYLVKGPRPITYSFKGLARKE